MKLDDLFEAKAEDGEMKTWAIFYDDYPIRQLMGRSAKESVEAVDKKSALAKVHKMFKKDALYQVKLTKNGRIVGR